MERKPTHAYVFASLSPSPSIQNPHYCPHKPDPSVQTAPDRHGQPDHRLDIPVSSGKYFCQYGVICPELVTSQPSAERPVARQADNPPLGDGQA